MDLPNLPLCPHRVAVCWASSTPVVLLRRNGFPLLLAQRQLDLQQLAEELFAPDRRSLGQIVFDLGPIAAAADGPLPGRFKTSGTSRSSALSLKIEDPVYYCPADPCRKFLSNPKNHAAKPLANRDLDFVS